MKKAPKPMRGLYKRGTTWWGAFGKDGRLVRRSLSKDRALAEKMLEEIRRQIDRGDFEAKPKIEKITVAEMVAKYLEAKAEKRSIRGDEQMLRDFCRFYGAGRLDQLAREDIERHLRARKQDGAGNATRNRILACLRHLCNVAIERHYLQANPTAGIRRAKEPSRRKFVLSEQELQAIVDAASPHLQQIITVAIASALRKSDLLGLRWEQIDFPHNVITIWTKKTGEPLDLPLVPWAREALLRMKASANGSPHVLTFRGSGIKDCKTAWRGARRRASEDKDGKPRTDLTGYRFHDLRRTSASMMHRAGATLVQIQRLLGHASVTTTEKYLGIKWEETAQAIKLLDTPPLRAMAEQATQAENCTKTSQPPVTVPETAENQHPN